MFTHHQVVPHDCSEGSWLWVSFFFGVEAIPDFRIAQSEHLLNQHLLFSRGHYIPLVYRIGAETIRDVRGG